MNAQEQTTNIHPPVGEPNPTRRQRGEEVTNEQMTNDKMPGDLSQRLGNWAQGRLGRFLLTQLGHAAITLAMLAALLVGAARVGALDGVLATAAQRSSSSFTTTINYQGRLADSSGNPLDGTYGMSFSLWDAATDGGLVWGPESHAAVPVSDGLFSVGLGSQTSGGIPTSTWNGDRYLEITVGGETLSPRELIRSVPIAGIALTVLDGTLASRHVHLDSGAVTPADHLSLTTSPQTVPGMSANLSPATDQTYLFYLVAELANRDSSGGYGAATLYVDGVGMSQAAVMSWDAGVGTVAQVYRVDMAAGTHTVEVRAHSSNGEGAVQRWQTSLTWLAVSQ